MENTLAYISGVVDGEGCLSIGKYPRKGNKYLGYRGYFSIGNTHIPMLEFIKSVIGGKIIEQGNNVECFALTLTANEIRRWLPELSKFLIVKKEQAEVLLSFLEKQFNNASAPISQELIDFYENSCQKMKLLKKVRFKFKEKKISLGIKKCIQCENEFELFSSSPKKIHCSIQCKKKTHWIRSNARIRAGIPAWSKINSN